jgi:hypothetical protein
LLIAQPFDQQPSHITAQPAQVKMLLDAIRWNMLNIIRVELFFNCYKLWDIFVHSSLKSPKGQYAIASFAITFLAQFTVQFDLSWLLSLYAIYLLVGVCVWIYRRVYFYHRRLDSIGINQTINHFETNKQAAVASSTTTTATNGHPDSNNYATLKKSSSSNQQTNVSPPVTPPLTNDHTNSLQRQRASAYRDFRSLLTEPRRNHREFAMSLVHLSNVSKLVGNKDVFDEIHFQLLATRRDVVNILLRAVLIVASSLLAYMR